MAPPTLVIAMTDSETRGRDPMKFVVLMAEEDPEAWDRATQEYRDRVFDRHRSFDASVRERGEMVAGEALAYPKAAVTLRPGRGRDRMVTEGPYAETAEQLGGFYLIDVDSEETALDLVRLLPDEYTIEVRPVIQIEGYDG
jgi:hypothetical protein